MKKNFLHNYGFSLLLLSTIVIGSVLGFVFKEKAVMFKPFGDIFLNLLFTVVVPLVFFSISSAIANMADTRRLGKILSVMLIVFILTGIVSSVLMVMGVSFFPPAQGLHLDLSLSQAAQETTIMQRIVEALTVSDFLNLFSRKNMLALIIFAMLIGLATSVVGERGQAFRQWLTSANDVMIKVIEYVMLYAPIGLAAYFAYLVGVFGPQLLGSYARAMMLYYPLVVAYFFIGFSMYAFIAAGRQGVKTFWTNIIPASLTALATGSSVATIPLNLEAAKRIGTPEDIREVVIPIGATIHMDGSCLSAILKIAVLFGIFQMDFTGASTIITAIGIALLSGTVMSGIPGGGFVGEMMIVTLYGFPPEALVIISMIGTLVDPPATMVNAIGDNVSSMMVARFINGKNWMQANA
ncbi:MAG TPA: dicarboxylate/amino acid:cation symporter [Candidatus Omnitrophota bacterium]|nr:dicarboxylate/amino acid:cation symporter [Candidatus Omnitrophota bacterium]